MSLSNTVVKAIYTGTGSNTDFSIPFDVIYSASDETVVYTRDESAPDNVIETLMTEGVDYTLVGTPVDTVRFGTAPANGIKVLVKRSLGLTQLTDFLASAKFPVETNEKCLDNAIALIQELQEKIDRAPVLPDTWRGYPFDLPEPVAGKVWFWNSSYGFEYLSPADLLTLAGTDASALGVGKVIYLTSADSPYTVTSDKRGYLLSCDTTGGNITINLPSIASLDLTYGWSLGVKKSDASGNSITIDANGSEEINGGLTKGIVNQLDGCVLIPDVDATPDEWSSLDNTSFESLTTRLNAKLDDFAGSTDNAVVRTNGTGGDSVQESGVTIDDSDNMTVPGNVIVTGDLTVNGTTTNVNTTNLDVTDANITVNNGGNQATANSNKAGLTVEMSDATDAVIGYDSTLTSKFKLGESGSEAEVADVSSTQTFTNKTLTSAVLDGTISGTSIKDEDTMVSDSADHLCTQQSIKAYVDTVGASSMPIGTVIQSVNNSTPTGFLACEGATVSRTTYSALYAIIGDAYGNGDGSTTFHLPDMRGMFARGVANGSGNDPDRAARTASASGGNTGDNIGSAQGTATKRPTTAFSGTTGSQNANHTHTCPRGDGGGAAAIGLRFEVSANYTSAITGGNSVSHQHTFSITGGGDNESRPPNVYFKYYIKY